MTSFKFGINLIYRLEWNNSYSNFGQIATLIDALGGDVIGVDMISSTKGATVRDVTISVSDADHGERIATVLGQTEGVRIVNMSDRTMLVHLGGKIEITPKLQVKNRDDLSHVYTPHVARVCKAIQEDVSKAYQLTIKRNTVAVISDGTAVLGLGDIGPHAAMPVMEGKAMLFKQFGGIDAFPICLDTKDPDAIVQIVQAIAPAFGGINLEDISSPRCFEIEERLKKVLDIPVFHDDQHGTAVVLLAGLINALRVVEKRLENIQVVVVGIGAAGIACTKMMLAAGVQNILGVTLEGIIHPDQLYDNPMWNWYKDHTNPNRITGSLEDAMRGADVFIGLSGPGVLTVNHLKTMAPDPIVFAMANPTPEIMPEEAGPYVRIMATGRSDYPNQINNLLCFPGLFKGALRVRAHVINEEMKLAAAHAIAALVTENELCADYIIPSVFNPQVADRVADAVAKAAQSSSVARKARL